MKFFSAVVVCMNFFFWIRACLQLPVSISLTFPQEPGNWISRKGFQFTRTRILSAAYLCFLQATVVKWWVVLERVLLKLMGSWQLLQHGNNRFLYKKKSQINPKPYFSLYCQIFTTETRVLPTWWTPNIALPFTPRKNKSKE